MAPIKTALKSAGTAQRQRNPMLTLSLSREDARHGDEIDSKIEVYVWKCQKGFELKSRAELSFMAGASSQLAQSSKLNIDSG